MLTLEHQDTEFVLDSLLDTQPVEVQKSSPPKKKLFGIFSLLLICLKFGNSYPHIYLPIFQKVLGGYFFETPCRY